MSAENWDLFAEFCRQELATGGPDPQVALMVELSKDTHPQEKMWLAGCYCSHHTVPSAYVVWKHFRPEHVIADETELREFLAKHWDWLPVRPEMRSHRMIEKRLQCLRDFARFAVHKWDLMPALDYNEAWKLSIDSVKYFARYMAIKYLEILHRMDILQWGLTDMRAKSAWSPRIALGMLYPEVNHIIADKGNNTHEAVRITELHANRAVHEMRKRGVPVSFFQIQVLMCEFREALVGGYYPGASHDEELDYIRIAQEAFGPETIKPIFDARRQIFPHSVLGELNGWNGLRQDQYRNFKGAATYDR